LNNFDLEQELTTVFDDDNSKDDATPKLALYVTPICPYCIYVQNAISKLGLDVEIRNIYSQEHFEDLVAARNRATVPVLLISHPNTAPEETWLPESMDIIAYLAQLKATAETN